MSKQQSSRRLVVVTLMSSPMIAFPLEQCLSVLLSSHRIGLIDTPFSRGRKGIDSVISRITERGEDAFVIVEAAPRSLYPDCADTLDRIAADLYDASLPVARYSLSKGQSHSCQSEDTLKREWVFDLLANDPNFSLNQFAVDISAWYRQR